MKKPKHTPGPWKWDEMDGRIYITPEGRPCHYVADINSGQTDPEGDYPRRPQREANARLISSAPCLLDALKGLMPMCEASGLSDVYEMEIKNAEAVIKQAEGKS